MLLIGKRFINLDYNDPFALTADDIPMSVNETLAERVNSNINGAMDYKFIKSVSEYITNATTWIDIIALSIPSSTFSKQYRINWYSEIFTHDCIGLYRCVHNTNNIISGSINAKDIQWSVFTGWDIINSIGEDIKLQFKLQKDEKKDSEDEIKIRNIKIDIWRTI